MATRVVYKIWQLVPYTKYGNSCQNATSWLVYIGGSLNPLSPSELPGATPKSIFLFFKLEEAQFFWPLQPPPLGL